MSRYEGREYAKLIRSMVPLIDSINSLARQANCTPPEAAELLAQCYEEGGREFRPLDMMVVLARQGVCSVPAGAE